MIDKKFDERSPIRQVQDWLVAVLTDNPGLKDNDRNDNFSGQQNSMLFLWEARYAKTKDDYGKKLITQAELKKADQIDDVMKTKHDNYVVIVGQNIESSYAFFKNNGIKNKMTNIAGKDVIVIDLEQDDLVNNLRKIFYKQCVPEKMLKGSTVFTDPDGKCFNKDGAKAEIEDKMDKLIKYAQRNGVGEKELAEIYKEASIATFKGRDRS